MMARRGSKVQFARLPAVRSSIVYGRRGRGSSRYRGRRNVRQTARCSAATTAATSMAVSASGGEPRGDRSARGACCPNLNQIAIEGV
jgi:hypothetical protein